MQNIVERIDNGYKLFFRNRKHKLRASAPSFKKVRKYKSFTLKTAGYKYLGENVVVINKVKYKFFKSRNIEGKIKNLTVKRDTLGDIYIYFICEDIPRFYPSSKTCNKCKHVLDELPLKIREWKCPKCGAVHDRDRNAALNIWEVGTSAYLGRLCKT